MRIQRAHGWIRDVEDKTPYTDTYPEFDPKFLFVDTGYNLRLTEPQAAMGIVQLPKLADIVHARRHNHAAYAGALSEFEFLRIQRHDEGSSCFGLNMVLKPGMKAKLAGHLNRHGIETRPIICGNLATQPALRGETYRVVGDLANSTDVLENGLSIGCHHLIDQASIDHVANTIGLFVSRKFL